MSGATYVTTKGGVNSFTLYLARRYARYNVRANCLVLGYMDTPLVQGVWQNEKVRDTNLRQVPMRRFGTPWERRCRSGVSGFGRGVLHHRATGLH